jgi:hypothetical protein
VRRVLPLLNGSGSKGGGVKSEGGRPATNGRRPGGSGAVAGARISGGHLIIFADQFVYSDPILPEAKLAEAREMAAVYPMLYVIENSMRELIRRVLSAKYGQDWLVGKGPHLREGEDDQEQCRRPPPGRQPSSLAPAPRRAPDRLRRAGRSRAPHPRQARRLLPGRARWGGGEAMVSSI